MSKKRIVFITPGITTGGAEKQLALLAKGLLRDDFSPLIVVLSKSESGQRLSDFDGLHVVEINCRKLLNLASALRQVRVTVTGHKPDIIQGWMYAGNIMASIMGLGTRSRIYHSLRASDMDLKRYGRKVRLNAILSRFTDGVIANSQVGAKHHISHGFSSANMLVIPNGIDTKNFFPDTGSGLSFRRDFDIDEDARLVLYAARVDPMKDHKFIISIAELCLDLRFIFVGKGTDLLNVPNNVLALGVRNDMQKIYNACDLALNISKFGEGFPNVIGEAMACGVPVLANDVGDSWHIMGVEGHRLRNESREEIAQQLRTILNKTPTLSEKQRTAFRISEFFSKGRMVSSYSSLYMQDEVVKSRW